MHMFWGELTEDNLMLQWTKGGLHHKDEIWLPAKEEYGLSIVDYLRITEFSDNDQEVGNVPSDTLKQVDFLSGKQLLLVRKL